MTLKVLSLCSGVGGAELALSYSDFTSKIVGYSEIDQYAQSIYEKQFPDHINLGDLTKIDTNDLEDFDMLIAGFPCQAFSVAGKQKGFDDTRGTIFFDIARILEAKKPKYFLFENVKNLISHDKGNTFKVIANRLIDMGYNIRWDVLNSKDFGVPQNRERIYIRGVLKEYGMLPDISLTSADLIVGTDVNHDIRMQRELINRKIKARVHQVDIKGLQQEIYEKKRSSPYTIEQIAEELGVPSTQVAHYFRIDDSFAIPTPEIWFKLKDILGIYTDEFDKSLTEFEIREGVYDQSKRMYKDTGISPTITASGEILVEETMPHLLNKEKGKRVSQGLRVYAQDSISCTQTANGGGWGAKTGLYVVPEPLKIATATKKGYDEVTSGDGVRLDHPGSVTGRGRTQKQGVGTLTCSSNWGIVDERHRIRRLVPLESERLQGFPDNWTKYGKDNKLISDAQRYKCMGNAFTVNVIKYILNSFFDKEMEENDAKYNSEKN
ncbi:MAG: DNA (cytosine-5-)-methyltransferase [Bacilli bacterium]|nr:DNA (cytosine-5-)-methyltransferase [Bacilli bacterium]